MKARRRLGLVRPLALRTARGIGKRFDARPALVWRAEARREGAHVTIVRRSPVTLLQTFPLSVSLSWLQRLSPTAVVRREHVTVRRGPPRWRQAQAAGERRIPALVAMVAATIRERIRRELTEMWAVSQATRPEPASSSASSGTRVGGTAGAARAGAGSAGTVALRPWPDARSEALPAPAIRPLRPVIRRLIHLTTRTVAPAAGRVPAGSGWKRPEGRSPASVVRQLRAGETAGSSRAQSPRPPRQTARRPERRAPAELVWASVSLAAPAAGSAAIDVLAVDRVGAGSGATTWHVGPAAAGGGRTEVTATAPPPDMNRLVDEVVRRLDRIARDERTRRGI